MATYYQQYIDVVTAKGEEEVTKNKAKFIESYNNIASTFANTDKAKAKELLNKTLALRSSKSICALKLIQIIKIIFQSLNLKTDSPKAVGFFICKN